MSQNTIFPILRQSHTQQAMRPAQHHQLLWCTMSQCLFSISTSISIFCNEGCDQ
eukprot:m.665927 g.665927  ORF g.665927 m.665927 type:complete len:54 (+) comp58498_c0_seq1:664-825(+)